MLDGTSLLKFLSSAPAQAVVWTAVLAGLVAIGYAIARRFRDGAEENQGSISELITNFSEMHREGDISDAEYRTIKTMLGTGVRGKLKSTGQHVKTAPEDRERQTRQRGPVG